MNHKYEVIIYWSDEDSAFVAEIPELPGCHAHGSTQQEALDNVSEAADLIESTVQKPASRKEFLSG